MRVALICSAHGFGHLTRQLVLARALRALGASPVLFTAAPAVARSWDPSLEVAPWAADVGIVQRDSLREDIGATITLLEERCAPRALEALAEALGGTERAVVDIAPPALEACRMAGLPTLAMGNFDWAWIYRRYPPLGGWAERFAAWQAPHRALELEPGPGLFGFAGVEPVGLLGRRAEPWRFADGARRVLLSFGGAGLEGLQELLPELPGVRWVLAPPMAPLDREDCELVVGARYPALVAGVDLVFTKPGYGIFAECALAGTPMVWVRRLGFPEAPHLERAMSARGDRCVAVDPGDPPRFQSALAEVVRERLATPRPAPRSCDAERVARRVLA